MRRARPCLSVRCMRRRLLQRPLLCWQASSAPAPLCRLLTYSDHRAPSSFSPFAPGTLCLLAFLFVLCVSVLLPNSRHRPPFPSLVFPLSFYTSNSVLPFPHRAPAPRRICSLLSVFFPAGPFFWRHTHSLNLRASRFRFSLHTIEAHLANTMALRERARDKSIRMKMQKKLSGGLIRDRAFDAAHAVQALQQQSPQLPGCSPVPLRTVARPSPWPPPRSCCTVPCRAAAA